MSKLIKPAELVQRLLLDLKLEPDVQIQGALQDPLNAEWRVNKVLIGKVTSSGDILIKLNATRVEALLQAKVGRDYPENIFGRDWVLIESFFYRCWRSLTKESVRLARLEPEPQRTSPKPS